MEKVHSRKNFNRNDGVGSGGVAVILPSLLLSISEL